MLHHQAGLRPGCLAVCRCLSALGGACSSEISEAGVQPQEAHVFPPFHCTTFLSPDVRWRQNKAAALLPVHAQHQCQWITPNRKIWRCIKCRAVCFWFTWPSPAGQSALPIMAVFPQESTGDWQRLSPQVDERGTH